MPKGKEGNETQYRFLFIISTGGHPMNMYEVIKFEWDECVVKECVWWMSFILTNGNDFKQIWNPLK